ncbi:MAG: hypothetical protein R3313_01090 [Candidatus Saccharimonadales bacterium]|nr:hypothetical protein [Candidatus Saccharimonadales bacterium]
MGEHYPGPPPDEPVDPEYVEAGIEDLSQYLSEQQNATFGDQYVYRDRKYRDFGRGKGDAENAPATGDSVPGREKIPGTFDPDNEWNRRLYEAIWKKPYEAPEDLNDDPEYINDGLERVEQYLGKVAFLQRTVEDPNVIAGAMEFMLGKTEDEAAQDRIFEKGISQINEVTGRTIGDQAETYAHFEETIEPPDTSSGSE